MLHRMPSACCVPTSLPDWWTSPVVRVIDVGAVGIGTGTDPAVDRHARYALNGCVLPVGERVRGYVQLSDTDTMNRVWGDRWGGTVDGLFVLQDVVTAGTVRVVEFELVVGEPARIYRSVLDGAVLGVVYRGLCQLLAGPRLGWRTAVELSRRSPRRTRTRSWVWRWALSLGGGGVMQGCLTCPTPTLPAPARALPGGGQCLPLPR